MTAEQQKRLLKAKVAVAQPGVTWAGCPRTRRSSRSPCWHTSSTRPCWGCTTNEWRRSKPASWPCSNERHDPYARWLRPHLNR